MGVDGGSDKDEEEDKSRHGHWVLKRGSTVKVPGMKKIVFFALTQIGAKLITDELV